MTLIPAGVTKCSQGTADKIKATKQQRSHAGGGEAVGTEEQRTRDVGQGRGDSPGRSWRAEFCGAGHRSPSGWPLWPGPHIHWHTEDSFMSVYSVKFGHLSSDTTCPRSLFLLPRHPATVGVFPPIIHPSVLLAFLSSISFSSACRMNSGSCSPGEKFSLDLAGPGRTRTVALSQELLSISRSLGGCGPSPPCRAHTGPPLFCGLSPSFISWFSTDVLPASARIPWQDTYLPSIPWALLLSV